MCITFICFRRIFSVFVGTATWILWWHWLAHILKMCLRSMHARNAILYSDTLSFRFALANVLALKAFFIKMHFISVLRIPFFFLPFIFKNNRPLKSHSRSNVTIAVIRGNVPLKLHSTYFPCPWAFENWLCFSLIEGDFCRILAKWDPFHRVHRGCFDANCLSQFYNVEFESRILVLMPHFESILFWKYNTLDITMN